jgi:hypothetical protein
MPNKNKLLFDGRIFHRIEDITFGDYPIFTDGIERLVINNGKVIHRKKIIEDESFLRLKGGGERKRKRFSNNRADFVKRGEGELKKARSLQNKEG